MNLYNIIAAIQARDSLADVSGYYQQDHGCKVVKTAGSLLPYAISLYLSKPLVTTTSSAWMQPG